MNKLHEYLNEYLNKNKLSYSNVYVYIPKRNKKPCILPGCRWYVYFYYKVGDKRKQFKIYKGINRIKSIAKRKKAITNLREALQDFLDAGNDPFNLSTNHTILSAFEFGYKEKVKDWSKRTNETNEIYYNDFKKWLSVNSLENINIKSFSKNYILAYISILKDRNMTNVSINNYRRFLSSVFAKIAELGIIEVNFIRDIKKLKEVPKKNRSFSMDELKKIKDFISKDDPILYQFIQIMTFTFLRPIEVCRLKVGDIDMNKRIIYKRTKSEYSIVPIISKLAKIIKKNNYLNYDKNYSLVTYKGYPFNWQADERIKYRNFSDRFIKVKKHFNFGSEYGLYSFRHTFAKLLYNKYLADGMTDLQAKHKLMTITRHKSLSSLNKYLRNIGAFVPDDYSDDFTFDF